MTEYMHEDNEVRETLSPEWHYNGAILCLSKSEDYPVGSTERTNALLNAIAHAMVGGLRDGLDYSAKQPPGTLPPEPFIEEDDTRP